MEKKITKRKTVAKPQPQPSAKTKVQKKAIPPRKKKTGITAEVKAAAIERFGLHNLTAPIGSHKRKKLLGRGPSSGHGKTSTRGSKGQTSRSGRDFYLGFEGGQTPLIRRIPKRGFTSQFKKEFQIVNLVDLNRIKETNVTLELLEKAGLIKDKAKLVKILGDGEVKNAISIQAHTFSRSAEEKIKQAGGKVEIIHA